jgi:hypothetical protein
MAFSDFTYPEVFAALGLREDNILDMFAGVPDVAASATLRAVFAQNVPQATMNYSEAARATLLVAPIISELWARYGARIGAYYGVEFNADPEAGLTGYCDFLITRAPQLPRIVAPVAVIVEAKRDNLENGYGQCIAGMVGAQRFNRRAGNGIETVYGASTTGISWRFLRLSGSVVTFDTMEYSFSQVDRLLGILTSIVGPAPGAVAA